MKKILIICCDIKDFKFKKKLKLKQKQSLVGKYMLCNILNINLYQLSNLTFYNKFGKPFLKKYNFKFNISHSDKIVLLGISNVNIGVDIEKIKNFKFQSIKYGYLNPSEIKYVNEQTNKLEVYYKMWTIKEAILKLIGTGLITDPKDIIIDTNTFKYARLKNQSKIYNIISIKKSKYMYNSNLNINHSNTTINKRHLLKRKCLLI